MVRQAVPFSPPDITQLEVDEVVDTLKSGWITTGARTKCFEKRIAEYIGNKYAVVLNSQTAAAEMTLRILGIGPGDEVIVPAYTYTASASVVAHTGAKIVMLDVSDGSFEMDYNKIAGAITEKTKAIIPVDLGGRLCDYKRIYQEIESKKKLFQPNNPLQEVYGRVIVIADSAHGFGAIQDGKKSGQLADFTTFSFHAVKNLTTGEGGAVTWRKREEIDEEWLYHQYMLYSLHGQSKDAFTKNQFGNWEYDIIYPAFKCNMTDIQAAIGLKQLERYDKLLDRRREIIERYDRAFLPFGIRRLVHYDHHNSSSGHLYLARIPGITEEERNKLIAQMAEKGIACNVHYKPLPMMTAYQKMGLCIEDYPNSYQQYKNEISLPLHTCLNNEDVEYVIGTFIEAVKEIAGK